MSNDELEQYLVRLRKLIQEVGEVLADRVRKNPEYVDDITRGVSEVAMAASGTWYCILPGGRCQQLDPTDCLSMCGTPVSHCTYTPAKASRGEAMELRDLEQLERLFHTT